MFEVQPRLNTFPKINKIEIN